MNWEQIRERWKQLHAGLRRRWGAGRSERRAREKQLAEWRDRRHEIDPIHK